MICRGEKFGHNFIQGKCLTCNDPQQTLTVTHRGERYEKEKEKLGEHKIDHSFQAYCIEIRGFFPKEQEKLLWKTFHDYFENDIRKAFRICRDRNILDVKYLRGVLKRL